MLVFIQTIISIATAIVVHLQLRSTVITGAENSNGQPEVGKSRLQQQARIFKTIAIMQIGFVITVGKYPNTLASHYIVTPFNYK